MAGEDLRLERESDFTPIRQRLDALSNRDSFPAAVVLLSWLLITEHAVNPVNGGACRTDQSFFIETFSVVPDREQKVYRVTDLECAFGENDWPERPMHRVDEAYELPFHLADLVTEEELVPAFRRLSAVDEREIASCFDDYPEEWCPRDHRDLALEWTLERKRLICKRWKKRDRHITFADRDIHGWG